MTVLLRAMTVDDLPAIMQLEEDLFAPDTWTASMYREELGQPDTR
jgi:ribosomal-protein-alanine N-acetyltransferase